jgi:hypothetical protein
VTIDGKTDNEARRASNGRVEIYGGFTGNTAVAVPAGVHTLGLAVERTKGAGSGKCTLTNGYFETYEKTAVSSTPACRAGVVRFDEFWVFATDLGGRA